MSRSKSAPATKSTRDLSGRYHHGDLKNSLVQAALIILERDGADALSMRAIAGEVGVSHTAPYAHFKNKRELIKAVTEMGYELMADGFDQGEADRSQGKNDVVLCYGAAYLKFAMAHPQLYRLMLGQVETRGLKEVTAPMPPYISRESITLKRPFMMLNNALAKELNNEELAREQAVGAWALVHGLSALLIEGHLTVPDDTDLKSFLASVAWQKK